MQMSMIEGMILLLYKLLVCVTDQEAPVSRIVCVAVVIPMIT
jgi:hypothetical protein